MHLQIDPQSRQLIKLFKPCVLLLLALVFDGPAKADSPPATTHFSYSAPNASDVGVAGEFNSWKPKPMTRGADGTWTVDVPLAPGEYGYKFVVSGSDWVLDPNNTARKTVNGVDNSAITVGGPVAATGTAGLPAGGSGVLFTYSNPTATSVNLAGQFNNWDKSTTPMLKDSSGVWSVRLPLGPGRYQYKLYVDGAWMLDPGNPQQVDDGTGNKNSVKEVVEASAPAVTESAPAVSSATPEDPMSLGGTRIQPKEVIQFDIPLPAATWRSALLSFPVAAGEPPMADDMRLKPKVVHVGLAVPKNFNPEKRWPLLIVSAAPNKPSVDDLGSFYEVAADDGWVSISTDVHAERSSDSNLIRWAGLTATMDFLHAKWPASENWPVAVAGYDGGAKKTGYLAAMLSRQGFNLIGIWLGGVNEETPSKGMHAYNPPHVRYLHTPVFVSSGKTDKSVTPQTTRVVFLSLESSGFLRPKLGTFLGGHEIDADQVKQGLDWFIETINAHPTLAE